MISSFQEKSEVLKFLFAFIGNLFCEEWNTHKKSLQGKFEVLKFLFTFIIYLFCEEWNTQTNKNSREIQSPQIFIYFHYLNTVKSDTHTKTFSREI